MSMPNGVPQSPMWFSRMTVWPASTSMRTSASPIIVVRRWPTCISLATFGASSRRRPLGVAGAATPSSGSAAPRRGAGEETVVEGEVDEARAGDLDVRQMPSRSAAARTAWAISRGGRPRRLARASAPLAWASARSDARTTGSTGSPATAAKAGAKRSSSSSSGSAISPLWPVVGRRPRGLAAGVRLTCPGPALVAQGIEHRPPGPCAQVRILPEGAHSRRADRGTGRRSRTRSVADRSCYGTMGMTKYDLRSWPLNV